MPDSAEPLDLDAMPSATGTAAAGLERERGAGLPYGDYFRFLAQFERTEEELRRIPPTTGPRFTLD